MCDNCGKMRQESSDSEGAKAEEGAAPPPHYSGTTQELFPVVYRELRGMAQQRMWHERAGTLQTTALVHEVYLRLSHDPAARWANPRHFFAAAAEAMRRILVDRARRRRRQKRGGGARRIDLETLEPATEDADPDALLSLSDALDELRSFDPDLHEVVMLRFFAGMTVEQVAGAIARSARSVKNDWSVARAWLLRRMDSAR